ncbi:Hypothetical predicted protein [Paramuricea clavata]|uniref:Uncharacterized protein n=1 Tax=Paramuricea clavata TaxID=317549 RepID=A0A7D9IBE9_PARCT|nr:Hypothetical predicted protein [Paramuricea clavata]
MRPFRLGQKLWDRATVKRRYDERSYEVETDRGNFRRNRVDIKKTTERNKHPTEGRPQIGGRQPAIEIQPKIPEVTGNDRHTVPVTTSNNDGQRCSDGYQ